MKLALVSVLLATTAVVSIPLSAQAEDGWHLTNATAIEGKGSGWDYVSYDAATNRLFLGHRGNGLQVFDPVSHKVVATVAGTSEASANGAVLIPEFDLGISNNENGTLIPFKLSTLAAQAPIKAGEDLDTSHYDPASKRLVLNMGAGKDGTELIMLDVPALKDVGHLKVPSKKVEGADSDGHAAFYLAAQDLDKLYKIDTKTGTLTATFETAPACGKPTAVAVDAADNRVFVSCRGHDVIKPSFVVLDDASGKIIYSVEIGGGSDSLIYDPALKRIFSANGVGANLSVIEQVDANTYKLEETLGTRAFMRTMAMDHKTGTIYAVTAEGSADPTKKILTVVSPFYPNTFYPNTYTVLSFAK